MEATSLFLNVVVILSFVNIVFGGSSVVFKLSARGLSDFDQRHPSKYHNADAYVEVKVNNKLMFTTSVGENKADWDWTDVITLATIKRNDIISFYVHEFNGPFTKGFHGDCAVRGYEIMNMGEPLERDLRRFPNDVQEHGGRLHIKRLAVIKESYAICQTCMSVKPG